MYFTTHTQTPMTITLKKSKTLFSAVLLKLTSNRLAFKSAAGFFVRRSLYFALGWRF